MKRVNISLILISFLAFGIFLSDVKADEVCRTSPGLTSIANTAGIPWTKLGRDEHTVYYFEVNGAIAFCQDFNLGMNSSVTLTQNGCSVKNSAKKALKYCNNDKSKCGPSGTAANNYLIAQAYVWGAPESDIIEAYCVFNGNSGHNLTECKDAVATAYTVRKVISDINKTSAGTEEIFNCWYPENKGSGWQRLASMNDPVCTPVCPPDSQNPGKHLDECIETGKTLAQCIATECGATSTCIGYAGKKMGNMVTCTDNNKTTSVEFWEEFSGSASGTEYTGSINGSLEAEISKYGALYCKETSAKINLPGGLANPIRRGSSLVWPTYSSGEVGEILSPFGNMFPLSFKGTKKCRYQIAPDLTYEDKCDPGFDPVKHLESALNTLGGSGCGTSPSSCSGGTYNNNEGDDIPVEGTEHDDGPEKPTLTLGLGRETIRYSTTYSTCRTLTESGCADSKYFTPLINWAKGHYDAWKVEYDTELKECEDAGGTYTGTGSPSGCESTSSCTSYSCLDGSASGSTCTKGTNWCKANDADVKAAQEQMDYWSATKRALETAQTNFNSYASAYHRVVTEIYMEVWKIAYYTGIESCDGSESCPVYFFETDATVSYKDEPITPYYGQDIPLSSVGSVNYTCPNCKAGTVSMLPGTTSEFATAEAALYNKTYASLIQSAGGITKDYLSGKVEELKNLEIKIDTNEIKYKLPDGLYYFLNKDTGEYTSEFPAGANYIKLGYSNLPTSYNNKVGKKYDLGLINIVVGHNGQFGADYTGMTDYTCHYTVGDDSECVCPPGTKHAGIDLYGALYNTTLTCADAQLKYCDPGNIPKCEVDCDKYCPNDRTIKLTSCVNSGKTQKECEELLCHDNTKYICPSGTDFANMDITSCVQTRYVQNKVAGIDAAKKYCEKVLCNGASLIYRTIDLINPFPGKSARNGVAMPTFNTTIDGRYPGLNWNSVELVKMKIIENEGVSNYEIYDEKPLYHFELNTSTILKIREYNATQDQNDDGYNDFTLDCNKTDGGQYLGRKCISKNFVHNSIYGIDNGTKSKCGGDATHISSECKNIKS